MRQIIPETSPDYDTARIIERPDGFYWQRKKSGEEYGPFPTLLAATEDMQFADADVLEPGETIEEAEAELGIEDWIDPDSGELSEEVRPHIDDDH